MTAPTEQKEREAFEAHITRFFATPEAGPFSPEKMFYRINGGRYFKGWLQSQWEGWQARAAADLQAVAAERERCARIVDAYLPTGMGGIAAAIRGT